MQLTRWLRSGAVVGSMLVLCAFPASSAAVAKPPELKTMTLRLADFPRGTKVTAQGFDTKPSFVAAYSREFELSRRYGRSDIASVLSSVDLTGGAAEATRQLQSLQRRLQSLPARRELAREIASSSEGVIAPKDVTVSKPIRVAVGESGFELWVTVRVIGIKVRFAVMFFRVNAGLGTLGTFGDPFGQVLQADVVRLGRTMAAHMREGLRPRNVVLPGISGTAAVGETLQASVGRWKNFPSRYATQWQRCDAAGDSCVDIPGATETRYILTGDDAGRTLRIEVTAGNSAGATTAVSPPSAVVTALPVNAQPPAISGTPAVGQTLATDTGTWTNAATFTYQWQRCDAGGAACVPIPDATTQSYTVASADIGFTLRAVVTASNAIGSTSSVSAQTAVVTA